MVRSVAAVVLALAIAPPTARAAKPTIYRLSDDGAGPQLGVDARGNAVAAWQQSVPMVSGKPFEQTSAVVVSLRRAGGGFGKPRPVTRLDLAVRTWALAMGSSGDGAVVWQSDGPGSRLYVQRRRSGTAFGPAVALPGSSAGSEPAAAIDARGHLLVAWLRSSDRDRCGMVVMATIAPRNGAFRDPKRLTGACGHAGWLRAALARGGDGAVAWRSSGRRSAVSHSTIQVAPVAAGHFRPERAASAVGNVGETFALAAGGRRAIAVWRDTGAAGNRVLAASISAGRVAPPVVVVSTQQTLLSYVEAAMSPRDAAIVGWQQAPRGSSVWDAFAVGAVAVRPAPDAAFGPPEVIAEEIETESQAGLTGLALDASGGLLAGYDDVVRRRPPAGPWSTPVGLRHRADFSDPQWPPRGDDISVGLNDAGEGVAVWDLVGLDGGSDYMRAAVIPAPR